MMQVSPRLEGQREHGGKGHLYGYKHGTRRGGRLAEGGGFFLVVTKKKAYNRERGKFWYGLNDKNRSARGPRTTRANT